MEINLTRLNKLCIDYKGLLRGVEIVLLALTLIAAIIIGNRQNDINERLVDLNYFPSVEIVYDSRQLRIFNHGDKDVFIGPMVFYDKFSGAEKINVKDNDLRLIAPGGFYYFPVDILDTIFNKYKEDVGLNGEFSLPFDVFLKSLNDKKYVAKNFLFVSFEDGNPNIRTQTLSIIQYNW